MESFLNSPQKADYLNTVILLEKTSPLLMHYNFSMLFHEKLDFLYH